MTELLRVEPASQVAFGDVEHAFTGGGDGSSCWCQWFVLPRRDFGQTSNSDRRELLRRELAPPEVSRREAGYTGDGGTGIRMPAPTSPGLIAYVGDDAAGWVRVGPRAQLPRLMNSRVVKSGSSEPVDAPDVWAVSCLVVRREFRGRGVASGLVSEAVRFAAREGARVVEAYAIDTAERRASSSELYVGSVGLFARSGFTETSRPLGARVVMTYAVSPGAAQA